jgi:TonB family protein
VSSAANAVPPKEGENKEGNGTPRPNPVALEVLVNVTGAKPSGESGTRDLFLEETSTVLVFKDGAVIRLHTEVTLGQLLFLTNKRSNQEVVCQVLRKRSFKPGSYYVELQFTEERDDYWGVAFPEEKKSAPEFIVAEQVQAEKVTAEETDTPVEPHRAEDVDKLKREVEALREQLAALEKKNEAEATAKAMAEASAARDTAVREAAMRDAAKVMEAMTGGAPAPVSARAGSVSAAKRKEELAPVNEPAPREPASMKPQSAEKPELLMPPAPPKDKHDIARAVVNMSLPVWKMEKSPEEQLLEERAAAEVKAAEQLQPAVEEPTEELLPKPALDFSKALKDEKKNSGAAARPAAPSKARALALGAVLVLALAGGAWYGKWWEHLPIGNKAAVAAARNVAKPNAARPGPAASAKPAAGTSGATTTGVSVDASKNAAKDDKTAAGTGAGAEAPAAKASDQPAPEKKLSWRERLMGKKTEEAPKQALPNDTETVASGDAPLVAAKLLKAANPVYPPQAMRSYITGDVKAEVVVLPSGRVGDVKVISGPQALRAAAVDALKQYEYAPATQGGKAVESKAEAVVKFWFNP